ncbi:MAG TPA: hypothetical protein VL947_04465 [Cytophagales bacterium]|nr:hypothetical protein [Cytophagales bacterium]
MKKLFIIAVFCFISNSVFAKARIPLPYCSSCEYIQHVADLPDDSTLYASNYNGYLDVGYKYKQFWLLWIPVWNFDGEYCLMIKGKEDVFFETTPEELKIYQEKYKLDLPENPISFWNKIGGKLAIGLLAALAIYGMVGTSKKEEAAVEEKSTTEV